jgi:hypothetical protein
VKTVPAFAQVEIAGPGLEGVKRSIEKSLLIGE